MGLFDLFRRNRAQPAPQQKAITTGAPWSVSGWAQGQIPQLGAGINSAGETVNSYTVLQSTAAFACLKLLSDDVAKLPVVVYRELPQGGWSRERSHPVGQLMRRPNRWQTAFAFWQTMVWNHQLRGNAYAVILRDNAGVPTELIPIQADRVGMMVAQDGSIFYTASHKVFTGETITVPAEDMLHVRNYTLGDGYLGVSVTQSASEAFALSLATQKHASSLFGQGTQLGGVLKHPQTISPEAAARLADSWRTAYTGQRNAYKVAILEEGMTFEPMSMSAEEAQLIEARDKSAEEIARIFRVPPHKIGLMGQATFSNLEEQNLAYINETLTSITTPLEQEMEMKLLFRSEQDQLDIKFDFRDIKRGSLKTQMDAYAAALLNGILTLNEVRERENLPRIEGGDQPRVPLNTTPVVGGSTPSEPSTPTPTTEPPNDTSNPEASAP